MQNIDSLADQYSHMINQLPGLFLLKSCDSKYFGFSQKFGMVQKVLFLVNTSHI